jgi:carbon-monoxide dehydrogenase small subunit
MDQGTHRRTIRVTVNGTEYERSVEPRLTLVDFLRGDLGLGGTHVGCEHGMCGACTVRLNGQAVRSCIMLAVQADGMDVATVEGMSTGGQLHPIQEAFMACHGLQCGFCTPGFLMAVSELLETNSDPDDDEIKDVLAGNLCRCTGYADILASVRLAARKMRELRGATEPAGAVLAGDGGG